MSMARCKMCNTEVVAARNELVAHLSECTYYDSLEKSSPQAGLVDGHVKNLRDHTVSFSHFYYHIKGKLPPAGPFENVNYHTHGSLKKRIIGLLTNDHYVARTRTSTLNALKDLLYRDAKLAEFSDDFWARVPMNAHVTDSKVYYRVMSDGEKAGIRDMNDPFFSAFDYNKGATYLYWMSSSLAKVKAFGNENVSDTARNYGKFTFKSSPLERFGISPSQNPRTATGEVLHMHQEGFAELGMFDKEAFVDEVKEKNLDHNIGFRESSLHDGMQKHLESFEFV